MTNTSDNLIEAEMFPKGEGDSLTTIYQRYRSKSHGRTSPLVTRTSIEVTGEGRTQCRYIPEGQWSDEQSIISDRGLNTDMSGLNAGMHELQTRQRMLPWLEARVNSGEIVGLEWMDREKKVFKVPWKHVGNRDWREIDGKIFMEWAVHTGKYRENIDQPDYPTWKTRFRTALTKLPDIKELKDQNRLDQQTAEPYRVYMFLPRNNDSNEVPMTPITPIHTRSPGYEDMCPNYHETEPGLPTTIGPEAVSMEENRSIDARLDSDLRNIPSGDIFHPSNDIELRDHMVESVDTTDLDIKPCDIKQEYEGDMETTEPFPDTPITVSDERQISTIANKPFPGQSQMMEKDVKPVTTMDQLSNTIHVTVKYCQHVVIEKPVFHPAGCHLYYDLNVTLDKDQHLQQMMFGPSDAYQIPLPECHTLNSHQVTLTSKLLRAADRGVLLNMKNGNIIATRKCRCSIFVLSPSVNGGELTKLTREEPTVVFDVQNYFRPALEKYLHKLGPKPGAGVILSFGQRFNDTNDSLNNLLISASIEHLAARNLLTKIACTSPMSPPIEISKSDNYDRILDLYAFNTSNVAYD